ncbi:RNA polymerase sigma factor [Rubrivirga sp. IMCC45206]|uniref:RNA polymerase sigma factor n=1 Tax=Rubrivirga sp. IMCC45206 TaxID=3391614 RepID=UPI0039901876
MSPDALVRQHADLVYRVALRVTGTPADAADATQNALVKVWRGVAEIPDARRRAWCARVARNAALDLLRKRRVRPEPGMAEAIAEPSCDEPLPDDHAEAGDLRVELARAVDTLAEPYRSILVLREIEGLSYHEICDALDLPLNTLKVYLHRARRRVRDALTASAPELVP